MQEHIPDDVRGIVGGVQQSWNSFFFLLSFAFGLVLPDPKDFYLYSAIGYAGVGLAVVVFAYGFITQRPSFLNDKSEGYESESYDSVKQEETPFEQN